jgi:protein phosphatase
MSHRQILEFSAQSDTGRVREHNEDAIIVCAEYGCVVLADGMGGYNAGEIASAMATQIVADYLCEKLDTLWLRHVGIRAKPLQRWMAEAISEANRQILESSLSNPECSGMGTTIVATCLFDHKILVAHVGDSRAYVFRQGKLVRLA